MAQHYDIDGTCPVCGDTMIVARLHCETCGSSLEGAFQLQGRSAQGMFTQGRDRGTGFASGQQESRFGRLARLDSAQLEFVEAFLRCRGVIRNVEDMLGISYPTVKARLASVLDAMGFNADNDAADSRRARREILERLAAGQISTEEAHRLLALAQQPDDTSANTDAETSVDTRADS